MVIGIKAKDLEGRLLRQNNLRLQQAIELSKASEITQQQLKSMKKDVRRITLGELKEFKTKMPGR